MISDNQIRQLSNPLAAKPMISPFSEPTSGNGIISYGVTSYGYDARLSNEFAISVAVYPCHHLEDGDVPTKPIAIDPKNFKPFLFDKIISDAPITIPPHGFVLARTIEYFKIPREILVICVAKSTYARCGLGVLVTPLEPEWEGHVTLELANFTDMPITVYPNEGICQFIFLTADESCGISYADKAGKYQGQRGITFPVVK